MDNIHQASWGYTPTSASTPTWIPSQSRSMKRTLSESDCDDLYSEESSKDQTSPGESTTNCHLLSRKKRRGVIEKRRRDRINSSLSELKTLVPSAYEKQGSAKLEKAEILQLTVEHLKSLNSKGIDTLSYDPQRYAMNYHIIGFRECAAEVARYLVTIEGMDIQDPLRLRLMAHLQYFVQQRELSMKTNTTWPASTYQSNCTLSSYQPYPIVQPHNSNYIPNLTLPNSSYTTNEQQQIPANTTVPQLTILHNDSIDTTNKTTSLNTSVSQHIQHAQHQPSSNHQNLQYMTDRDIHQEESAPTYIELSRSNNRNQSSSLTYDSNNQYPPNNTQEYPSAENTNFSSVNCTKPYRPWGAEMVY